MKSFLTLFALAVAWPTLAENWPQFRGPTGQGISRESNLPLHWNAGSNVLWKASVPGEGWSTPIVWGQSVFVTSVTDSGTRCHVMAFDVQSGKALWDRMVFEQVPLRKESKNSYASPTPVTDGERVLAVFGDGSVVALSMEGSVLWTNREVKFYSRHGLGSSPVLHDGLLIMPFDGSNRIGAPGNYPKVSDDERLGWQIPWDQSFIAAFDVKTGKRVWTGKRGMSRIAHVTPIIVSVDDQEQVISPAGDRIQGFDPKTGTLIWSVYSQGEGVTPTAVVGDGLLFTASGFEKTTLRAVKLGGAKGDATETHVAWEQRKGVPTRPSLIYKSPYLYGLTEGGIVTCYEGKTGEVLWQERLPGDYSASPVLADDRLYFTSESGETTVTTVGKNFKILAKNPLPGRTQASMAVADGRLFIRTDKELYCIAQSPARQ